MSIFSRIKTAAASTSGTNPFNRVKEIVRAIKFSASPRLYGRFSSGAGEGEEIRIGSGLSIINGELVASATNTINSSTASDGTANISVLTLDVVGTLTANHIHGNLAGAVYTHVRAGENLAKGDPVYVSGFHGSGSTLIPIVSKADASNPAKMPAIGVMDAAVANNANGHMVITGTITEFNTNAYSLNAELYVANGGGLTATPPTNSQAVARVERANANNGAIIVKIGELATSASTANTLVRRGANGEASFSRVRVTAVGGADAVTALSATGVGVSGSGGAAGIYGAGLGSGAGLYGDSEAGVGMQSTSQTGTNHAEFGDNANNRSFIRRVLGLIGWWRGSFTQTLGAPSVLTANRAVVLPDADGTLLISGGALGTPSSGNLANCTGLPAAGVTGLGTLATQSGTFSGTSSGTNTGDETGARIAALINAATVDANILDADQIPLTETAAGGALRRATFATVWNWITGKLAALTSLTVGGAWNFSSTTRPTSSGTGAASANSLITRDDAGLEIFLNAPRVRRMTLPNALASVGTAPAVAVSSGIVANANSFALSSAGGARLIEYPSALSNTLPAFNQPIRSVVHGRFLPATTAGSGVARVLHKTTTAPALADATDAIVAAGWGVEFYASGGGFRARLFARPNPAAPCLYSGSGTGAGTVAVTAAADSYMAVMLVNDGAGNLSMHLLAGQAAGSAQGRIPDSPALTWTGAIASGDLTRTYNPSLLVEIANASSGTAGVIACAVSAMSTL